MVAPYDISGTAQAGAEVYDSNNILTGILNEDGNILSPYDSTYFIGASIDGIGNILDLCGNIVPLAPTTNRGNDIKWMDTYRSNRHIQSYYNGFVDISGGDLYLREKSNMYINQGDISLNGMLVTPEVVIHENSITCKNKTLNIVPANRGNHNNTGTVKVKGNMTIDGSLNFIGDYIITNTNVTVTEQVDISNDGTGPALIARQMGDETVVEFYDDAAKVFEILDGGNTEIHRTLVVHDTSHGSDPSFNCRVGIGTQPEYKLDVHGVGFIRDNVHINTNNTAPSFIPSIKGQLNVGISQIGYVTFDDVAMFSHIEHSTDASSNKLGFALAHKRIGETILNAKTNEFINFSIENDQKMLLDTSGTLTIGHNTTQYTDANGIERHIPLDYVKLDVNGNARITGHTFIGGSVDISGSNVDLNGGKLYIGSGNSFLNQGRITRDELPVGNPDPLVFGSDQFSFSLLEYANPTTNRTQASVASFEGNLDLYGLTFVNGTHIQDNLVINNGEPFIIENTEVNTTKAVGEPTFKLIQDYDDLNKTDNDFIQCIARDFGGTTILPSTGYAPAAGTDAPVKAFVLDICGNIAIRTNKPAISLDISGEDAIRLPAGGNLDRPEGPKEGYIRFNNETNVFEGYREIFDVSNGLMQPYWDTVTTIQDVDQDTKILAQDYPGADNDELKFFTSGSERMRIYADGKVGIGTDRPEVPLHIFYSGASVKKDLSANIGLILENDAPHTGNGSDNDSVIQIKSKGFGESMIMFNNNNTDLWGIQSGNAYDDPSIAGFSATNKNFSIVDLENFQSTDYQNEPVGKNPRFSIAKATGNIGIGTMSPAVKLDIKGVGMVDTANSPAGCDVFLDNVPLSGVNELNYRGATLIFDGAHGLRGPNKIRLNLTSQYGTGVSGNQVNYFTMDDHVWYYCRKRAGNDPNDARIPYADEFGNSPASLGYDAYNTEENAKIGMELRQEALTVYNDISGNNEGKIAYSFYAAHKLDYTSYLGTAAIGYGGPQPGDVTDNYTGAATFAYWNFNDNKSIHGQNIKNTALRHLVTGETILNSTIISGTVAETALRIRTQDTDAIRIGSDQRIGINTDATKGQFHIHEDTGRPGNGTQGGTLTISHGDQAGTSSIIFKNKLSDNTGLNDYAYIRYKDSYLNSFTGNGSLEIGSLSNINEAQRDSLILQKEGGYVGIGTAFPHHPCHVEGPVPFNFNGVNSNSVFYDDVTQQPNPDVADTSLNVVHIRGRCIPDPDSSNKGIFGPIFKVESTDFTGAGPINNDCILVGMEVNTKPTSTQHIKVENNMAARFLGGRVSIGLPNAQEAIEVSGNILATESLIANSDKRIKTNIEPITNALEKVESIRGVYFNKINSSDDKKHIGVIGQEIEEVFPELVETYTENHGFKDFKGVKYANLVAPLIEAIKELSQQNKLLQDRISTLENKFS